MKIRTGFVSNSSSSSFIVLLPDNYDWEKEADSFIEANGIEINDEINEEKFKESVKECVRDAYFEQYDNYCVFKVLSELFKDYVMLELDVGSDRGEICILEKQKPKMRRILEMK